MIRAFSAALRGTDGRSLARALAALVVLNALTAGLHGGAMAATPRLAAICTMTASADEAPFQRLPRPGSDCPSCVVGCATPMASLTPPVSGLVRPSENGGAGRPVAAVGAADGPAVSGPHGPRGPPLLA